MTYNILQEIEIIAENKSKFEFNQEDYNAEMSAIFKKYRETKDLTIKAQLLCHIAIGSILLVGNNIGFEKIEKKISAARIKDEVDELASLERLVNVIPTFLIGEPDTKANIKSLLRAVGGLVEFNKKNFRQSLRDRIIALLA